MNKVMYTEEQIDGLQEIINIAIGKAGAVLAEVLDHFVELSVPKVTIIDSNELSTAFLNLTQGVERLTATRQSFVYSYPGEAVMVFGADSFAAISDLLGYQGVEDQVKQEREFLLEITNMLVTSCLSGMAELLSYEMTFSPPSMIAERVKPSADLGMYARGWSQSLFIQVHFGVEGRDFKSYILAFWPDEALIPMRDDVDRFMEEI